MADALTDALRHHLERALDWHEAHATFDDAVANVPEPFRGKRPPGMPHTLWQLLEHLRRTQHDILDFCRNPAYVELAWPDDYWPEDPAPANEQAWDASVKSYREDRAAMKRLAVDRSLDLAAKIPHGAGQTYLREVLLVIDHNSYHVGQLIATRLALGIWPAT